MKIEPSMSFICIVGDAASAGQAQSQWAGAGLVTRTVRGHKMRTTDRLFDECSAAFQFPWYFGENRDAFDECLADLPEWLPPHRGYVWVITRPEEVLVDEVARSEYPLSWLIASFKEAAQVLSAPIQEGEWWDRPAISLKVVLFVDEAAVAAATAHWRRGGATVEVARPGTR